MKVPFLDLKKINYEYTSEFNDLFESFLSSGRYILGSEVEQFENDFSQYCGTSSCIGVANGLDALKIVLMAWKELGHVTSGDEVIVPSNTFIASVLAIIEAGLKPVLVEPNSDSLTIDVLNIEKAITQKTRVVMAVHLYGKLGMVDEITKLCKRYDLLLLEDAAQAHGAQKIGKMSGSFGDAAAFSFYPGKNLGALGDGGAITTSDLELANTVKAIRNYGSLARYEHLYSGVNSRLDELQAGILRIKLKKLNTDNENRRRVAKFYSKNIKNPLIKIPVQDFKGDAALDNVYHLFVIRSERRNELQKFLADKSIETLIHYPKSIPFQSATKAWFTGNFTKTKQLETEILSLPISQVMNDDQIHYVVNICNSFSVS